MNILFLSDFVPAKSLRLDASFKLLLEKTDIVVFNLEGSPKSEEVDGHVQIMPFDVDELLEFFREFENQRFIVALANNHILDNSREAFDSLIATLKKHNIEYFGSKDKPYILIDNKIGILNFVTAESVARFSSRKKLNYLFYRTREINQQIQELESRNITRIFYPHWGRDMDVQIFKTYENRLKLDRKKWFVFGHHPHVISGVQENHIYSLGNTYIPHPFYYRKYPAVRYGLAVILNSESKAYNTFLTEVQSNDNFKHDFLLKSRVFEEIPDQVRALGKDFSSFKKLILSLLAFKGNKIDIARLWILQLMSYIFTIKIKRLKK